MNRILVLANSHQSAAYWMRKFSIPREEYRYIFDLNITRGIRNGKVWIISDAHHRSDYKSLIESLILKEFELIFIPEIHNWIPEGYIGEIHENCSFGRRNRWISS